MTTLSVPSWGNSALVTSLFNSFQFSMTSLPMGPGLLDFINDGRVALTNVTGREIMSQPLDSDLEAHQKMLKFLKDSAPPYRMGSKEMGFAVVTLKTTNNDRNESIGLNLSGLRRFADSGCVFFASMKGLPGADRVSTELYFRSTKPLFAMEQYGNIPLRDRAGDAVGFYPCGLGMLVGMDFLETLKNDQLWNALYQDPERAVTFIQAMLNARYDKTGESAPFSIQFLPQQVLRGSDLHTGSSYSDVPAIQLVQNRMLAGEAPFADPFVNLAEAAAMLFPGLPLCRGIAKTPRVKNIERNTSCSANSIPRSLP